MNAIPVWSRTAFRSEGERRFRWEGEQFLLSAGRAFGLDRIPPGFSKILQDRHRVEVSRYCTSPPTLIEGERRLMDSGLAIFQISLNRHRFERRQSRDHCQP